MERKTLVQGEFSLNAGISSLRADPWKTPNLTIVKTMEAAILIITIVVISLMSIYAISAGSYNVWKGKNNDESTKEKLIELLKMTKKEIVIFDDGDPVLYDDQVLVKAFEDKIKELPLLKVRCFFNSPATTLFSKTFENYENVEIMCGEGRENRPPNEVHFKIIDNGLVGYLSIHDPGSPDRRVKIVDCSPVFIKFIRERASKGLLGPYLNSFEAKFASMAA